MNFNFIYYLKIGLWVAIPIVLFILPATFFDDGQSLCLSVLFFGKECFGCGMTRAIMHLLHFDIDEAIFYNSLSLAVLPLLFVVWLSILKSFLNKQP